ncbi:MAG TPA: hypothetical protein VNL91_05555, partial [Thermoanaerobaculia bacterium]|nr:hypothetical protein [Thermoanaerobaculia bacterium]
MRSFAILLVLSTFSSARADVLTDVVELSDRRHYDKYPAPLFDRDGRLWIAWTSMRDGKDSIVVRSRRGGEWSEAMRLDRGEGVESGARLLLDRSGNVWAFWHGRRNGRWSVFARRWKETWGDEQRLTSPSVDALHPAVALSSDGTIWVAYEVAKRRGFAIETMARTRRGWSPPARLGSAGSDRRPALAARAEGGVWLAWDSTRSGNYDIWLTSVAVAGNAPPRLASPIQVTADATIDDSPSIATSADGALWIAWNGMRGHARESLRADRHSGDAFVRVYRRGRWLAPPGVAAGALPGQVSFGMKNKTPRDAVDPYWHWKQTQNYPVVAVDDRDRVWIVWRTDATGAHNFDLWARIHDGRRWSEELHLTDFSPGRDEWPAFARVPGGGVQIAWESQTLPRAGDDATLSGGDVDTYNTLGNPNTILTARLEAPDGGWSDAPLESAPPESA